MGPPSISPLILRFFRLIARRYFRRQFSAVRISDASRWANLPSGPIIVYANHSSWWDPMVSVLLAERVLPGRRHYAPMDAAALARYPILRHIGIFPVERDTRRGTANFLRTSLAILERGDVIWITPQGRFADARERPLDFKPGLAALVARAPDGTSVLPLAIEYPFWDERLPEVLLQPAPPVARRDEASLQAALLDAMETLAAKSMARDPRVFTVLLRGRTGVGGFYEAGQRWLARLRGRRYQAAHTVRAARQDEQA